ncbi:nucleoporin Nup49 [Zalerion maritima]|uniref:Nucleoporin Nup49 n=1 Tax=Zalerion maritima TaxID=339359 RepID=A0AAD5RK97_9PEZI|nr:nucleoporin Nup49 [Zalerion maritima]
MEYRDHDNQRSRSNGDLTRSSILHPRAKSDSNHTTVSGDQDQQQTRPERTWLHRGLQVHTDKIDDGLGARSYAIRHKLTQSCTKFASSRSSLLQNMIYHTSTTSNDGLADSPYLPDLLLSQYTDLPEERLYVTDTGRSYVAETSKSPTQDELRHLEQAIIQAHPRPSNMKVELPLLLSDHRQDMVEYQRKIENRRGMPKDLPPQEPIVAENDEGVEWSGFILRNSKIIANGIENPKLPCSANVLRFLQGSLICPWKDDDMKSLFDDSIGPVKRPHPITPPHLPSGADDGGKFDMETMLPDVALDSDSSSIFAHDLEEIEAAVQENDAPTFVGCRHGIKEPSEEIEVSEDKKPIRLQDLNVEVPLLPNDNPSQRISPEEVMRRVEEEFSEVLDAGLDWGSLSRGNIVQISDKAEPHPSISGYQPEVNSSDIFELELALAMQAESQAAVAKLNQESLDALDTIARAVVPTVDTSIPHINWKLKKNDEGPWAIDRRAEGKMSWALSGQHIPKPPQERIVRTTEFIEDMLTVPDELPSSSSYIARGKYPMIVYWEDEELIESRSATPSILGTLPRGERLEDEVTQGPQPQLLSLARKRKAHLGLADHQDIKSGRISELSPMTNLLAPEPIASQLLDDMVYLRDSKRRQPKESTFFKTVQAGIPMPQPTTTEDLTHSGQLAQVPKPWSPRQEPAFRSKAPDLALPKEVTMIISAHIPHDLFVSLKKSLPEDVRMVERDYTLHNNVVWSPGSDGRQEAVSGLAFEADITISPATGMLITTILQVRQRPLPGKPGEPPKLSHLRQKIAKTCLRYERLVVLVSEGKNEGGSAVMMDAAAKDLTALAGFLAQLPCEVSAIYVPGGDDTVVGWIRANLGFYARNTTQSRQFISDRESRWDLFLRRIGFNSWASQVVLGVFKPPEGGGLTEFIEWGPEDRYATAYIYCNQVTPVTDKDPPKLTSINWPKLQELPPKVPRSPIPDTIRYRLLFSQFLNNITRSVKIKTIRMAFPNPPEAIGGVAQTPAAGVQSAAAYQAPTSTDISGATTAMATDDEAALPAAIQAISFAPFASAATNMAEATPESGAATPYATAAVADAPQSSHPVDVASWAASALRSLNLANGTVNGTESPLTIPLDQGLKKADGGGAPVAAGAPDVGMIQRAMIPQPGVRAPKKRDRSSLRSREALLEGREGTRQRRRWENDHFKNVPNAQPPQPSDWAVQPTHPVVHVPYHLARYWDDIVASKEQATAAASSERSRNVGRIPREVRESAKRNPAFKGWVRAIEEPVRWFVQNKQATVGGLINRAASSVAPSVASAASPPTSPGGGGGVSLKAYDNGGGRDGCVSLSMSESVELVTDHSDDDDMIIMGAPGRGRGRGRTRGDSSLSGFSDYDMMSLSGSRPFATTGGGPHSGSIGAGSSSSPFKPRQEKKSVLALQREEDWEELLPVGTKSRTNSVASSTCFPAPGNPTANAQADSWRVVPGRSPPGGEGEDRGDGPAAMLFAPDGSGSTYKRWIVHSVATYYGLHSASANDSETMRRYVFVGPRTSKARGGKGNGRRVLVEREVPGSLWGQL